MKLIDISIPVNRQTVCWENKRPAEVEQYRFIAKGDSSNNHQIKIDLHTGTHVDAPYHFIDQGKKLDALPLTSFVGPCYVAEINQPVIDAASLEAAIIPDAPRLLFKTGNHLLYEREGFSKDYVAFDESAAQWLAARDVCLVGIDYLSAEQYGNRKFPVHQILLGKDVVLLEGLSLGHVEAGRYFLMALPIHFTDVEAAPVRAVLAPLDEMP